MSTQEIFKLVLIFILIFSSLNYVSVSAVRINEVELNPAGSDSGNEWIELNSEIPVNLTGWMILSTNGRNMTFNASFSDFIVINTPYNLLTNDNNKISLLDSNGSLISETINLSDSYDDSRTWQFCNNSWVFSNGTQNLENLCSQISSPITQNTTANSTENQTEKIKISLDYDSEIYNDEEFEVKLTGENLEDYDYDAKIWLEDDETVISQIYDEDEKKWISGRYYVSGLSGQGKDSTKLSIRLGKDWLNFTGKAKIYARLRKSGSSSYEEESDTIKLIERIIKNNSGNETNHDISNVNLESSDNIIRLEKGIKTWKSRTEYIKEYSLYGFTFLLLGLLIGIITWQRKLMQ